MDNNRNTILTFLITAFCIFYLGNKPLAEILRTLSPILMISMGITALYFGVTIIRNRERLAADERERFAKGSFQRVLSLQYREGPLRLTITLAGIIIIGIGFLSLALAFPTAAFDGLGGIVLISVLTVVGSGVIAIIAALFMLRWR
jgi:hypothetical protein